MDTVWDAPVSSARIPASRRSGVAFALHACVMPIELRAQANAGRLKGRAIHSEAV